MPVLRYLLILLPQLLLMPLIAQAEPDLVQCQRVDQSQLRSASEETLLFLRCRAREISYEAPRLKGVTQKFKDDLVFSCLDQADAVEHQLRVGYGYTRETLAKKKCDR
ncbi:hypothetical protein ACUXAV_004049 [Cupriavidus metallidurans]|jgi:hypothetical protein|uniref:Uncharacterized protein n=1 Tax=Cupriavidus metallidurans (strain ATCC 43123 / DSM 2839 / NBRC 102507 / CH34) TaxID=266264 RepID=Q1LAR0_CUPMC|nr:hypothetical protein [Cupriavidus metallidurans]ABF12766.1 conserved hypothetical protein [Cupriavidus metallidurans CH34]AVA35421.1 hypothetical protein C3Z06_18585 [Cupriavidus metallidurans]KWW33210.1 hypothetical protein AU374_05579 [Cupriavidus metallidurans]MDE4920963.1 hypothetical protein [Cupriavidus metallidurans]QGS32057.1 hypothetical protein FOB83_24625 [Cupriavidus metallidurans]